MALYLCQMTNYDGKFEENIWKENIEFANRLHKSK